MELRTVQVVDKWWNSAYPTNFSHYLLTNISRYDILKLENILKNEIFFK